MEYVLGKKDFGTSLDGYESFLNFDKEGIATCYLNEEGYQVHPDSPEIYAIMDNINKVRAYN